MKDLKKWLEKFDDNAEVVGITINKSPVFEHEYIYVDIADNESEYLKRQPVQ